MRKDGNKGCFREQLGSDVSAMNLTSAPSLPPENSMKRSFPRGLEFQSESTNPRNGTLGLLSAGCHGSSVLAVVTISMAGHGATKEKS